MKNALSVNWTLPADAGSSRPMAGKLGRYMSMETGPKDANKPNTHTNEAILLSLAVWSA